MTEYIKDCPICDNKCYSKEMDNKYFIECRVCDLSSRYFEDHIEAMKYWNTRVKP